jgi:hypothetical protein
MSATLEIEAPSPYHPSTDVREHVERASSFGYSARRVRTYPRNRENLR